VIKKIRYYFFREWSLLLFCVSASVIPFQLSAQDIGDSSLTYTDSALITSGEEGYQNNVRQPDETIFRSVPDSTVSRMKKEKDFAYANDPAYWIKEKKVYKKGFWDYVFDFFESSTVRIVFYTLVAALIIFVLYRIIVLNDLFVFNASKKQKKISEEIETLSMHPATIDQHIRDAIDQKNYPSAVRYLYLKTLYELNDKNNIQFHPEATNNDYLNQMRQHKNINAFRFLTQVYEYIWYGKFSISEQQFVFIHNSFKNFQTSS
jgi:hypothetical protein